MRYLALAVFCASAFVALPAQACTAGAAKLPGYCCADLGKTLMDDNQANIIACVCETAASCPATGLAWKTMSNKNSSDLACNIPVGRETETWVVTKIVNGAVTCEAVKTSNISCPAGQAVTKIVNGAPVCTASAATPNPNCAAKTTQWLNGCVHYDVDPRWGHLIPNGKTGSYSLPASGPTGSASSGWYCYETTPYAFSNQAAARVIYSGTAVCINGAWQCNVSYSFPTYSIRAGWQWPAPQAYYNGPC